jgi:hypothetical protein
MVERDLKSWMVLNDIGSQTPPFAICVGTILAMHGATGSQCIPGLHQ